MIKRETYFRRVKEHRQNQMNEARKLKYKVGRVSAIKYIRQHMHVDYQEAKSIFFSL